MPDNNNPFAEPPPYVNPNEPVIPPVFVERPEDARGWSLTKREYDRIMAALEQHGILSANQSVNSPHPDQEVRGIVFGANTGRINDEGIVLKDGTGIGWRETLNSIAGTAPYALLDANLGGTTTNGAEIQLRGVNTLGTQVLLELDTGDGIPPTFGMYVTGYSNIVGDDTSVIVRHGNSVLEGRVAIDGDWTELTIASGVITVTSGRHTVDTQSDAGTDDLDTISGGMDGQLLVLTAANSARDVVLTESGNLKLAASTCTLDNVEDTIMLVKQGSNWLELARSSNGV